MSYAGFVLNPMNPLNRRSLDALGPAVCKPSCSSTEISVAVVMVLISSGVVGIQQSQYHLLV
jgi:hypothetical protein